MRPADDARGAESPVVSCPYCGELVQVFVDPGGAVVQEYVEDCEVCCRPWSIQVVFGRDGSASATARTLDGE